MSSSDISQSVSTKDDSKAVKRSCSVMLRELEAQDDISDGEYSSNFSIGANIDSEDEFGGCFTDSSAEDGEFEDLRIDGSRMAVRQVVGTTDLHDYEKNRIFIQPIIKEAKEIKKARVSSSITEIDKLVKEEIEAMEKEEIETMEKEKLKSEKEKLISEKEKSERVENTAHNKEVVSKKEVIKKCESSPQTTTKKIDVRGFIPRQSKSNVQHIQTKPTTNTVDYRENTKTEIEPKAEKRVTFADDPPKKDIQPVLTTGTANGLIQRQTSTYTYHRIGTTFGDNFPPQNRVIGRGIQAGKVNGRHIRKTALHGHMIQSTITPSRSQSPHFRPIIHRRRRTIILPQTKSISSTDYPTGLFSRPPSRDMTVQSSTSLADSLSDRASLSSCSTALPPFSSSSEMSLCSSVDTSGVRNKENLKKNKSSKTSNARSLLETLQKHIRRCGQFIQRKMQSLSCIPKANESRVITVAM